MDMENVIYHLFSGDGESKYLGRWADLSVYQHIIELVHREAGFRSIKY
jgi:hypothetical protein